MDDLDVQKGEKYWKQLLNFTDNGLKEIKVIPGKTLGIRTAFGMMVKSIIQEQRNIKGSKRSQGPVPI